MTSRTRAALLSGPSVMALVLGAGALQAQENLGVIILGEGKRAVQTDTAAPITVVDQEEIDDRQAGTIAELVDSVPGVTLVNGSTPQGSGINIRGFGANSTFGSDQKVLILIDGATTGAEELYRIGTQLFTDPALFNEVTVARGTVGSFEFGSGVIGGIVRAETKDASDFTGGTPGFAFHQTLQYASNGDGAVSSSTLAWQPTEELEFLANFTWRQQDDMKDGAGNAIGNSAFGLPSYLLKGGYTNGAHKFEFSFADTSSSERDVPYDTFQTTAGAFGNVDRDVTSRTATLSYNFNPDNPLVDLDVILSYADQQIDSTGVSGQTGGLLALVDADHQYETTKLTVKNTMLFDTGAVSHNLRLGAEVIRKTRLDASSAPGGTDNRLALFIVDDMQIGGFELSPALRYETSKIESSTGLGSYENDALMGGVSAKYTFGSGFAVFASAAYTENLPIIDDLGNATLMTQSEKSRTLEAGASYDNGNGFAIKANYFDTRVWDITSYRSFTPGASTDEVEIRGVELEMSYAMANGLYVDVNGSVTEASATLESGTVQDWANQPADSLQLTLGRKWDTGWDTSWEIVAAAEREVNGTVSPGYAVHNARATWVPQQGVLEGTEIRFGVENVFDRDYTPALSTRAAPGRNFKVTVMKTF